MSSAGTSRVDRKFWHNESNDNKHDNSHNGAQTVFADQSSPGSPAVPIAEFQTSTIAPTPSPSHLSFSPPSTGLGREPSSSLRISTDLSAAVSIRPIDNDRESTHLANTALSSAQGLGRKLSTTSTRTVSRTPSVKTAVTNYSSSFGASSGFITSPVISAMGDMTPLPSPLLSSDSPGPWKRLSVGSPSPPQFRGRFENLVEMQPTTTTINGELLGKENATTSTSRRKHYGNLEDDAKTPVSTSSPAQQGHDREHSRNRSVSEYIPDAPSQRRNVAVSGSHVDSQEAHMRREQNFAESRGITPSVTEPPTPPPSDSWKDGSPDESKPRDRDQEWFEARGRHDQKRRRWRSVAYLGQGTFSRVMLASSQISPTDYSRDQTTRLNSPIAIDEKQQRKKLVAIKICEHGPRGGASEERIEMSLKRELEIMQEIHHPSLVNLKAWSIEPTRAILVLSYCPGGDLFDIASTNKELLTPALLRRMFAELVGAVKYLHEKMIVHRDIKLENVLVNLTASELQDLSVDWTTYPTSVITLTDLGLSRRISDDERLETRCGSDDYAAPEVIMGQPYDGRATDAWSLGVLLYALLESRLPFDPHPGMTDAHRMRSRTSHRIARVEWRWIEYAGEDGEHEASEAKFRQRNLTGAMEITEGLLKRARSRWTLDKVAAQPWVRGAIQVDGGIKFCDEDEGEEV